MLQDRRVAGSTTIRRIEAFRVRLPLRKAMRMAGVELSYARNLVVRVTSDDGVAGWGEAAEAPSMTGETVNSMYAAVLYLAPYMIGLQADDWVAIDREWAWRLHGNHAAKSALDMALLDLTARRRGVPMHALWGPARRESVQVLWLIGTGSLEGDVAEACTRRAEGFTAFKIKVGIGDALADARRTQAICDVLGDGMLIGADANQGFDEPAAIEYVRAVENTLLDFVEQPVAGYDLKAMARVAAASGVAIGADEGIHSELDIRRHHDLHAAEGCSLKAIKLGGPRAVLQAGQVCHALGMRVNLACKIAESSIASAALLHLAAVVPALDWGCSPSNQYLAEDLVTVPITVDGGYATVPAGPGLGIEVDEGRLRDVGESS